MTNEHTVYTHGRRLPDESDAEATQRIARENIGGHARSVRAVYGTITCSAAT